jgi:hypothetical protein
MFFRRQKASQGDDEDEDDERKKKEGEEDDEGTEWSFEAQENAKSAEKSSPRKVANMTESSGNLCFLKGIGWRRDKERGISRFLRDFRSRGKLNWPRFRSGIFTPFFNRIKRRYCFYKEISNDIRAATKLQTGAQRWVLF